MRQGLNEGDEKCANNSVSWLLEGIDVLQLLKRYLLNNKKLLLMNFKPTVNRANSPHPTKPMEQVSMGITCW
jgi:hypothetical protein